MILSHLDINGESIDQRGCTLDEALMDLDARYLAGLERFPSFDESYARSYMCLSRDEKDFLELTCNGADSITIHSGRQIYPRTISRLFAPKRRFSAKVTKPEAIILIEGYFVKSREEFESSHVSWLAI